LEDVTVNVTVVFLADAALWMPRLSTDTFAAAANMLGHCYSAIHAQFPACVNIWAQVYSTCKSTNSSVSTFIYKELCLQWSDISATFNLL